MSYVTLHVSLKSRGGNCPPGSTAYVIDFDCKLMQLVMYCANMPYCFLYSTVNVMRRFSHLICIYFSCSRTKDQISFLWQQLHTLTKADCLNHYLSKVRNIPLFGYIQFPAEQEGPREVPLPVIIAVGEGGIKILTTSLSVSVSLSTVLYVRRT